MQGCMQHYSWKLGIEQGSVHPPQSPAEHRRAFKPIPLSAARSCADSLAQAPPAARIYMAKTARGPQTAAQLLASTLFAAMISSWMLGGVGL